MATKSEEEPKPKSRAKAAQKPEVRFVRGPDGQPVPVEKES